MPKEYEDMSIKQLQAVLGKLSIKRNSIKDEMLEVREILDVKLTAAAPPRGGRTVAPAPVGIKGRQN